MTCSMNMQDKLNPALLLATRADKMALSYRQQLYSVSRQNFLPLFDAGSSNSIYDILNWQSLFSQDGSVVIGLLLFLPVYGPRLCLGP